MKRKLRVYIDSGFETCARAPGEFCPFMGTIKFGLVPICRLFPSRDATHTVLYEKDGWVQRCPACKQAEKLLTPPVEEPIVGRAKCGRPRKVVA
jgi:hypothetical protein